MDWICDRIEWAYHWKKITHLQMEELSDRACFILNGTMDDEYLFFDNIKGGN